MSESDPPVAPSPAPLAPTAWSERELARIALLALTALALYLCYPIARPFVSALAWAPALAVVGMLLHRALATRIRWPTMAAGCSTIGIALLLALPTGLLVPSLVNETASGVKALRTRIESGGWDDALERHERIRPAWEWMKDRIDFADLVQHAGALVTTAGSRALKHSFLGTIELALVVLVVFYFLRDRDVLLAGVRARLPFAAVDTHRILGVARDTIFATVYGKVVVGLADNLLYPNGVGRYLRLHTVPMLVALLELWRTRSAPPAVEPDEQAVSRVERDNSGARQAH